MVGGGGRLVFADEPLGESSGVLIESADTNNSHAFI